MPQRTSKSLAFFTPVAMTFFSMSFAILLLSFSVDAQQQPIHLSSPNGKLQASIFVDAGRHLGWSLSLGGRPIVGPSVLGIDIAGGEGGPKNGPVDLGQHVRLG